MKYLLLFLLLPTAVALAQEAPRDSVSLFHVELSNGTFYIGRLTSPASDTLKLQTDRSGLVMINRRDVRRIRIITPAEAERLLQYVEPSIVHRYFVQPSAFPLEKGQIAFHNNYLLVNKVNIGITDRLSMGAGVVVPGIVWVTSNYSFSISDRVRIAACMLYGTVYNEEGEYGGVFYGVTTIGTKDRNASLGLGYGFSNEIIKQLPVTTGSFMMRVNDRVRLMGEGYFISAYSERLGVIIAGIRKTGKSSSIDLGILTPFFEGQDVFTPIPWLGISVNID